jgi:NAD-dependent deacetylase
VDPSVERAAELLREAQSVLFITGAGISADSGLPTYRGVGGLYEDRATEEGIPIEVALSGQMFDRDPALSWKYIRSIEEACRGARFNRGHEVIAEIERARERVWTLTQNVDGFHRDAGATNVIEIHGDVHELLCTECDYRTRVPDYAGLEPLPLCPRCKSVVRPDVVLFGEMLPSTKIILFENELRRGFDVVFSIGTTSVFPYIAGPVFVAARSGVPTVEINPARTEVSDVVDVKIARGAAEALDAIWSLAR